MGDFRCKYTRERSSYGASAIPRAVFTKTERPLKLNT